MGTIHWEFQFQTFIEFMSKGDNSPTGSGDYKVEESFGTWGYGETFKSERWQNSEALLNWFKNKTSRIAMMYGGKRPIIVCFLKPYCEKLVTMEGGNLSMSLHLDPKLPRKVCFLTWLATRGWSWQIRIWRKGRLLTPIEVLEWRHGPSPSTS